MLHKGFNDMAVEINDLIEKNYVNELLKKEAQLKTLESQMDPHFLYNTLDSINWQRQFTQMIYPRSVHLSDLCFALRFIKTWGILQWGRKCSLY